jgi:hypothetical protein
MLTIFAEFVKEQMSFNREGKPYPAQGYGDISQY